MTPATPAPTVKTLAEAAATLKSLARAIRDSPAETMTVVVVRITPEVATQAVVNLGAIADLVDALELQREFERLHERTVKALAPNAA